MPFQVLNDQSRSAVSDSIGNALSTGLQNLVSHKLNAMQEQKQRQSTMQGLQAIGYNPQQAAQLSNLDPQSLQQVVKQKLAEPGERAYANALGSILGEQPQNIAPIAQQQPKQGPSISDTQKLQLRKYLASPKAQKAYKPEDIKRLESFLERPEPVVQPEQALQGKAPVLGGLNAKQATEIAKIGLQARKEQRVLEHKEKVEAKKETKKYYDQILSEDKAAKEADDRLNKMERLVKKGDLPNSALYNVLKNIEEHVSPAAGAAAGAAIGSIVPGIGTAAGIGVGGALGSLVGPVATLARSIHRQFAPDTEEFEKLSNQFISGAKAVFGARITDQDLKAYMSQIPTLSNTDEGKLKIIQDMKIANKAVHLRAKTMKQIIREHGGERPADLPLLVDERIGDQLDELSREFIEA